MEQPPTELALIFTQKKKKSAIVFMLQNFISPDDRANFIMTTVLNYGGINHVPPGLINKYRLPRSSEQNVSTAVEKRVGSSRSIHTLLVIM